MFFIFLPIVIIMVGLYWYIEIKIPQLKEEAIQNGEVCAEFTSADFTNRGYGCCQDCNKLDLEYFKYEFSSSMFGADIRNCYCEKNSTITQIW